MTMPQVNLKSNYKSSLPSDSENDVIQLSLPVNPAYVSAVRLTASSVANRLGFDVDEIEDVKAAVSEACTFIIKNMPSKRRDEYLITFHLSKDHLLIDIKCNFNIPLEAIEDEMGVLMIRTLMDRFNISSDTCDNIVMAMEKSHKAMILD